MSQKRGKISIFSYKAISNIFFLYLNLLFSWNVYVYQVDMQSDCKGNGVRSRHIPWYVAPNRKICLRNEEKYRFSHIKQFRKRRKIAIFSYKAISNIFFCISASYFLDMFTSIRPIFIQNANGTVLDPVTFPGMGPLQGNMSRKRRQIAIFSYKAISNIFFCISTSYFLEMIMSIR